MPRPPDPERRAELLQRAVDYAVEHGVADLTLRPLAAALGVRPNTLVHHFGTKEQLLSEILNGVRDRLRAMREHAADENAAAAREDALHATWRWTSDPARQPFFRFFFEAYGLALRAPERYEPFLERVVSDWLPEGEEVPATLELAVQRGLLLDLLTTGDRERVQAALERFATRV
jgi:AcrR family transcriptional regulator